MIGEPSSGLRPGERVLALIERHLEDPASAARSGSRWLWTLAVVIGATLLLLVGAAAWLAILLLRSLGFG